MARQRLKKADRESERERVRQIHGRRGLSIKERRSDGRRDLSGAEEMRARARCGRRHTRQLRFGCFLYNACVSKNKEKTDKKLIEIYLHYLPEDLQSVESIYSKFAQTNNN